MDVLLIESHPGLARDAQARLRAAGHRVFRCTDEAPEGDVGSPCRGLRDGGRCPLDETALDAAVLVRVGSELRTGEHGAICAARHRIPLVVAGDASSAGLAPVEVTLLDDLPDAVERAAASGAAHASAVVRELLSLGIIARHELEGERPSIVVQVSRSPRRLALTLWLVDGDPRQPELVRSARQALRAFDPDAPVTDVLVRSLPADLPSG